MVTDARPAISSSARGARVERRGIDPEELSRELEVLPRGHPRIEPRDVGEEADLRTNHVARLRDIVAEDVGGARGGSGEPGQDAQRRGLSCAIAAEEAEYHARADDEVDTVESERVAEPFGQTAELDRSGAARIGAVAGAAG